MSFRGRLTTFFIVIVVVPMVTVGILLVQIAKQSEVAQADAALSASMRAALTEYQRAQESIADTVESAAADQGLGEAIRSGDAVATKAALRRVAREHGLVAAAARGPGKKPIAEVGSSEPVGMFAVAIAESDGTVIGALVASTYDASLLRDEVKEITGQNVVISRRGRILARTMPISPDQIRSDGGGASTVFTGTANYRAAGATLASVTDPVRLTLLSRITAGNIVTSSPLIAATLVLFFGIAVLLVMTVIRALQDQVKGMLQAAQRIGGGDFTSRIPVQGNDELASLAGEFNRMSENLATHIAELRSKREELDRAVARIGDALAQGLNRSAVLEILVETAMASAGADHGRAVLYDAETLAIEGAGNPDDALTHVMAEAERAAVSQLQTIEAAGGGMHALAHPITDPQRPRKLLGVMTIGRAGERFDDAINERLAYLLGRVSVSIENIGEHEKVSEQAITDDLTGLANNRHFREWMGREVERAGRFGHEVSLLLIDADDFKRVNDNFGHLQGDEVLAAIGKLLSRHARDVDMPARYGGEEFAIALPETGAEGATRFAERIRQAIEEMRVRSINGGEPVSVTVSIGVASTPLDADDVESLIAVADEALYKAKRSGRNRVVAARHESFRLG